MCGKKTETRFTIKFSPKDPAHLQVADILNRQKQGDKAQYIVDAVLCYIKRDSPEAQRPVCIDEKHIEAVVNRILQDRQESGAVGLPAPTSVPVGKVESSPLDQPPQDDEIIFDDAVDALGEDGFNAIAGALDMFRRK